MSGLYPGILILGILIFIIILWLIWLTISLSWRSGRLYDNTNNIYTQIGPTGPPGLRGIMGTPGPPGSINNIDLIVLPINNTTISISPIFSPENITLTFNGGQILSQITNSPSSRGIIDSVATNLITVKFSYIISGPIRGGTNIIFEIYNTIGGGYPIGISTPTVTDLDPLSTIQRAGSVNLPLPDGSSGAYGGYVGYGLASGSSIFSQVSNLDDFEESYRTTSSMMEYFTPLLSSDDSNRMIVTLEMPARTSQELIYMECMLMGLYIGG